MSEPINGNFGKLWINGEEEIELTAFQLKEEYIKESYTKCGDMVTYNSVVGVECTGSYQMHRTANNVKVGEYVSKEVRAGRTPKLTIIGLLEDRSSGKMRRASVTGVVLDDFTIFNFEVGTPEIVECPFTWEKYKFLDDF